jgi:hypothetical protein
VFAGSYRDKKVVQWLVHSCATSARDSTKCNTQNTLGLPSGNKLESWNSSLQKSGQYWEERTPWGGEYSGQRRH